MDLTGQTLGQYRITEKIGRGGMADVYKAFQPRLERYVAIKVLPPYLAHDPGFTARFQREARAIARLNHPILSRRERRNLRDQGGWDGPYQSDGQSGG